MDATVAITTPDGQLDSPAAREQGTLVRGPASEQLVVGDIPCEPPGFQARADLLAKLDYASTAVSETQAVAGMQGVGKTQLVAEYARARLAAGWRLVAWINAKDAASLLAGLAEVADAVGLSEGSIRWDTANAGRAVRQWLEADGERCLIVFDDAEDPDVLQPFVPTAGAARVLITGTRHSVANLGASVAVDVFTAEEALAFLARPTGLVDAAGAAALAAELGYLPLALAQAAAVIAGSGMEYGTYLERLRALPVDKYVVREEGQSYPRGVAGAVLLSLQAVQAADRTGVCTRVLGIIAMLSAAGIRRELLHVAGQAGLLASGGRRVPAVLVDRALEWLGRRSLLTFSLDSQTITMHGLVARVVRDRLARRQQLATAGQLAASALEEHAIALARSPNRPAVRAIPQHVTTLLENMSERAVEAGDKQAEMLLRLRFIALYHLIELGDSAPQATAAGERLTADLERLLGPDHPDTLNSRNSLAAAYLSAGRAADAIPLFEQIVNVWQRSLGPDHPDIVTSRNNLAAAYQDAGRVVEAIRLYELNLAARERLLGVRHPLTLNSQGNLATAYQDAGRIAEAIPLFEQTLAARERVLGRDHPDTQTSRRNLADAYRQGGRADEAIALLGPTLSSSPRVLRPDRPDTQTSRRNLAKIYRHEGPTARTIPLVEQTQAPRASQPPTRAAAPVFPADFQRPPADPPERVLPVGFRRPPADPARRVLASNITGRSAKPADHSSPVWSEDLPPVDVGYDREVVAAIAAGDPIGIAMAYDRYAAAVYGYCHAMLHDPVTAAEATRDTFVIAATTLGGFRESPDLRPWLYAVARNECRRLLPSAAQVRWERSGVEDVTVGAGGNFGQAELRTLLGAILVELKPSEREVIELSFRHDLHGSDLATALGMSSSRADVTAARARDRLTKALGALCIMLAGRDACPALGELLADWDGQLTEETRDRVDWHIGQCYTCSTHRRDALRPEALSALLPLAPLPPELREQVLSRCSATTEDAMAYRRRMAQHAKSAGFAQFSQAIRRVRWDGIRANPGVAIAAAAVAVWIVAAASVLLLTFTG